MSTSRIIQLAQSIASQTQKLDDYLTERNLPQPSFEAGAPIDAFPNASPDVTKAKTEVIEAAIELQQLLQGPLKSLIPEVGLPPTTHE